MNQDIQEENPRLVALKNALEDLSEKRATTREAAFEKLIKDLKASPDQTEIFLENSKVTLLDAIIKGLRKGGEKEQILSAQLLPAICINFGRPAVELYKETAPIFEELITNTPNPSLFQELVNCHGLNCFLANPDQLITIELILKLGKLMLEKKLTDIELAALISAWTLLATSIDVKYVYDILIPDYLDKFETYLKSEEVELRISSGEAIAFLFEVARDVEEESFSLESLSGYVEVDDLLDTLHALVQDKNRLRSKKEKMKQRLPFKEILNFVESGEEAPETIEAKHQKFSFYSWSEKIQLNAIREYLSEGFLNHILENEFLQDILGISIQELKKKQLSAVEKRMYFSPNSPAAKARSKQLRKQRDVRDKVVETHFGN